MGTNRIWLPSLLLVGVCCHTATAQQAEIRYELAQRIRAFESAWDAKANDAETKKRVAPVVNQAVQNYFRFNFPAVAKTIDQARHLLQSTKEVSGSIRWAEALSVVAETHLLDSSAMELTVTIKPFYKADVDAPAKPVVRLKLSASKPTECALGELPQTINVKLAALKGSADATLVAEIVSDDKVQATKSFTISRIEKLDERLTELKSAVEKLPTPRTTIEQATLAHHVKLLDELARKIPQETDYPASRLFIETEELAKATGAVFTAKRSGEYWVGVPTGKTSSVVRIQVPEKLSDKPVPVVVALHGMGGSENMFFDAYGNGIVPKLAKERGWIVVATRVEGLLGAGPAPAVPAILDELQKRYPIDAKRVFLIGHSMGAGHVLQLTQQAPERYAAAVALGGGGRVAKAETLKSIPFFVGCGKLDFALSGAKALAKSLESGTVTFKEYDDIEHLVIVREAAPEVFKFFAALPR